jgi:DNA-binding transcriptional regulator YhcF (GntR family)
MDGLASHVKTAALNLGVLAGQIATLEGMSLDPDDERPPYQQVAAALRAAILTGEYGPGDRLPSQERLSADYGVARATVQQALRLLREDGLIVSRQGSGVFVREKTARPVGLRPHIEAAFAESHVQIDFAGYTAETLHGALTEPLDKIRAGRLTPQSIRLRILTSDMSQPLPLPAAVDADEQTSAEARARMARISSRHLESITATVEELEDLGLVPSATVEARVYAAPPLFKAYVINGTDVFFGYYPVVPHEVRIGDTRATIYDSLGKDAVLFQHTVDEDPGSESSLFVAQTLAWFESVWSTVAHTASTA